MVAKEENYFSKTIVIGINRMINHMIPYNLYTLTYTRMTGIKGAFAN